jgi:hypothetical protein
VAASVRREALAWGQITEKLVMPLIVLPGTKRKVGDGMAQYLYR